MIYDLTLGAKNHLSPITFIINRDHSEINNVFIDTVFAIQLYKH